MIRERLALVMLFVVSAPAPAMAETVRVLTVGEDAGAQPSTAPAPAPEAQPKAQPERLPDGQPETQLGQQPGQLDAQPDGSSQPPEASAAPEPLAEDKAPAGTPLAPEEALETHRTAFDVLSERMIGAASKPVRFDWRKTTVAVAALGSQLNELNNFESARFGGLLRLTSSNLFFELGVTKVFTWGSESTRQLAMTPYRQPGRPGRLELDLNLGYPIAEGVVTAWPGFFPATELVLSVNAGFRYLYYPGELAGARFLDVAKAILAPQLTDSELQNLEDDRNQGMEIDPARYGLLLGLSTDVYFQSGFFLFPRVMFAVPLLRGMTSTHLPFWWELTLGLGFAI